MLSLPTELWLLIGAYLSKNDLLAAVQVNHTFHSQLTPLLYRNFIICGPYGGSARPPRRRHISGSKPSVPTPYIERSFATMERLKIIQSSPMLMGAIKSCTLCHFGNNLPTVRPMEKTTTDALTQVLQEGIAFISTLPHCRDIVIDSVHLNNRQLKQLISPHLRPANLSARSLTILDGDSTHTSGSQHQCPLKNLTICGLSGSEQSVREFAEWSMSGDLQSFSVRNVTENYLSFFHIRFFHIQLLQKSFPNLRRLELVRDITSTRVLECLPMLEELTLPFTSPPLVLTRTILPRLRTFQGSGEQARSIIPGRPITVLHVLVGFKGMLPSGMGDDALNFGSTRSILELYVKDGTPAEVIGQGSITRLCPSLQVFCLSPTTFPYRINANIFTKKYMHEFYRLKHLRHLDFKYLYHVPSNRALAWERSMCEAFRTRSTPNIHHVSFSSIVEWDRVPYDTTWIASGMGIPANQGQKLGETGWEHPFMAEAEWPEAPFPVDEQ